MTKRALAALGIPVATVLVLVLAYRFTAPPSRAGENEVLHVGALPVT